MDERHAIMFTTMAFGDVVDCGSVRLVIHAGPSYSAMEYAQETGRAERDGQATLCVALVPHSWREPAAPVMCNSWHAADYQKLEALFGSCAALVCRRQVVTAYLDGNTPGTPCDAATSQPYDVSRGNDEAMLEDAAGEVSLPPSYTGASSPPAKGCAHAAGVTAAARPLAEMLAALASSSSAYTAAPRLSLSWAFNWQLPPTSSPLPVCDAGVPRSLPFAATSDAHPLAPNRTTSRRTSTRHSLLRSADAGDMWAPTTLSMASAQQLACCAPPTYE
jgi:hypothetical protein